MATSADRGWLGELSALSTALVSQECARINQAGYPVNRRAGWLVGAGENVAGYGEELTRLIGSGRLLATRTGIPDKPWIASRRDMGWPRAGWFRTIHVATGAGWRWLFPACLVGWLPLVALVGKAGWLPWMTLVGAGTCDR